MPLQPIQRDGFSSSFGRFATRHILLMSGSDLLDTFLPKVTRKGRQILRRHPDFVKAQLEFYGVAYDDEEFTGRGTRLLQKALLEGKCDRLPAHIAALRDQMHAEWIGQLTHEELRRTPEFIHEAYFLTDGKPDRTKCPDGVSFSYRRYSLSPIRVMTNAINKVDGLHIEAAHGLHTIKVFLGWDARALKTAAKEHVAHEAEIDRTRKIEYDRNKDNEHAARYADYLAAHKEKGAPENDLIIGTYKLDFRRFSPIWQERNEMLMSIADTPEDGIFEAVFNFANISGIMMLGKDKKALGDYVEKLEREGNDNDEDKVADGDGEDNADEGVNTDGTPKKRKAATASPQDQDHPSKKAKSTAADNLKFEMLMKGLHFHSQTVLAPEAKVGSITFVDKDMIKFRGVIMSLSNTGGNTYFTGRKISDNVDLGIDVWTDYSRDRYVAEANI